MLGLVPSSEDACGACWVQTTNCSTDVEMNAFPQIC